MAAGRVPESDLHADDSARMINKYKDFRRGALRVDDGDPADAIEFAGSAPSGAGSGACPGALRRRRRARLLLYSERLRNERRCEEDDLLRTLFVGAGSACPRSGFGEISAFESVVDGVRRSAGATPGLEPPR